MVGAGARRFGADIHRDSYVSMAERFSAPTNFNRMTQWVRMESALELSRFSRDGWEPKKDPPCSTDAPPGSEEKIAVLAWRAECGVKLWHKNDASCRPEYWPKIWERIDRLDADILGVTIGVTGDD